MFYIPLHFEDYFIICSDNYGKVDTKLELAAYDQIEYTHKKHTHTVNYQVRFDVKRNCIQAIFQQTADKTDWRANFEFPKKIYDKFTFENQVIQLRIHGGWGDMWLACQEKVRDAVGLLLKKHPDANIEVFGWSLGSAIAQLAAEDIYFKFGRLCYLYTYGSVKPFFGKKTYNYVKRCCAAAYNFYDNNDVVGYMVPLFGWRAINHCKVKVDRFGIIRLFNPWKYHTLYSDPELYRGYKLP